MNDEISLEFVNALIFQYRTRNVELEAKIDEARLKAYFVEEGEAWDGPGTSKW